MSKKLSIISYVCLALILVGLITFSAGLIGGGKGGVYVNAIGIHPYKLENLESESITPSSLTELLIDAKSSNIKIFQSTSIKVETQYYPELTTNTMTLEGSKVSIVQKNNYFFKIDLIPYTNKEAINVVLPSDVELDTVVIHVNVSNISIEDVKIKNLVLVNKVGNVNLDNVTVEDLSLSNDNGTITINESTIETVDLKNDNGNITLTKTNTNSVKIENDNGKIKLSSVSSDSFDIGVENGDINISNYSVDVVATSIKCRNSNGNITVNAKAKSVDVSSTNGNITLNSVKADTIKVHTSNGKISGSSMTVNNSTDLSTTNGAISVSGRFSVAVNIETSNGGVTFKSTAGTAVKYNFDVKTSNGSVTINDKLIEGKSYKYTKAENTNNLVIRSTNGSITVTARGNE